MDHNLEPGMLNLEPENVSREPCPSANDGRGFGANSAERSVPTKMGLTFPVWSLNIEPRASTAKAAIDPLARLSIIRPSNGPQVFRRHFAQSFRFECSLTAETPILRIERVRSLSLRRFRQEPGSSNIPVRSQGRERGPTRHGCRGVPPISFRGLHKAHERCDSLRPVSQFY